MDGWVRVLRLFNSISVISRRWKGEHERLCAMKCRLVREESRLQRDSNPRPEVGSANRSATRTLLSLKMSKTSSILGSLSKMIWVGIHVSNICTKANRTLGFLRRNLYACPQEVKEAAYKGLVHPVLEYNGSVWDPSGIGCQNELEKVHGIEWLGM